MPAAIAHFLHAERVLEQLDRQNLTIQSSRDAFLWGAQGPDFLYCHRFLPWQRGESLKEYAEKLHHEKPSRIFSALRDFCEHAEHSESVLAYIDGFLCHYSLDRTCHPFVRFASHALLAENPGQDEEVLHNRIESALDTIMLRYERADLPTDFDLKRTVPENPEVQEQIAELYAGLLKRLFGLENAGGALLQSTRDCRLIYGLLNDRTGLKKLFAERMERKGRQAVSSHIRPLSEGADWDYANVQKNEWHWPAESGTPCSDSFFDLYERSVQESVRLIQGFLSAADYGVLTGEVPFV
jgi:hypothetical protein